MKGIQKMNGRCYACDADKSYLVVKRNDNKLFNMCNRCYTAGGSNKIHLEGYSEYGIDNVYLKDVLGKRNDSF